MNSIPAEHREVDALEPRRDHDEIMARLERDFIDRQFGRGSQSSWADTRQSLASLFQKTPELENGHSERAGMERSRRPAVRTHGSLQRESVPVEPPAPAPAGAKKVLAIDDSNTLREFISRTLTADFPELSILLAKDGAEGLRMAQEEAPSLILLDYILPDFRGDDVCRLLMESPQTRHLPIVLMSSSAAEITRTQALYPNVVKALAKPFTPDVLCSTVGYFLRDTDLSSDEDAAAGTTEPAEPAVAATEVVVPTATDPSAPTPAVSAAGRTSKPSRRRSSALRRTPAGTLLCGDTGQQPLVNTLLAIEQDRLSGTLRLFVEKTPLEVYFLAGRPVVTTTRNPERWWDACESALNLDDESLRKSMEDAQIEDGTPPLVHLAMNGAIDLTTARDVTAEVGQRLVAGAWTKRRLHYEFLPVALLPSFLTNLEPFSGPITEWAMESLRQVGDDFLSAMAWGEPTGIPAYIRKGYERIQIIPLNDDEMAFARLVRPPNTLQDIAREMGVTISHAQRILHRFLCLEILDYWPASLIRGDA